MVQIMPFEDAPNYRFNPFDLTKVWSQKDYPKIEVGKMTLNRWPDNFFAETEQVAYNPAQFVPGIGPSPDKMLQGRLFGYGDTHRYRLGVNHHQIPVNAPHVAPVANYQRDGSVRVDGNRGAAKNYEPNSFGGPGQTSQALYTGLPTDGVAGTYPWTLHAEDSDFVQAGDLYRLIDEDARVRLIKAIGGSLSKVSRDDIIERAVANFTAADPEYGARVEAEVKKLRATAAKNDPVHESAIIVPDEKA
jgi:catalase